MARANLAVVADMDAVVTSQSDEPSITPPPPDLHVIDLPKTIWINPTVAPNQKRTKDRLGQQVQDTVKDGLGVRRDDVAAFTEAPGDGIDEPEGEGPDAADEEGAVDVRADGFGVIVGYPADVVADEKEGDAAEGEVGPLLMGFVY